MTNRPFFKSLSSTVDQEKLEYNLRKSVFAIPSVNGGHLLRRMLPTLNMPPEIITVLDQGSQDDTSEVCAEFGVGLQQLGIPHTYTECCNIALQTARERGADYLFISNNDIRFSTDVSRELLYEMLSDSSVGILSCSQLIVDENSSSRVLSNRVFWNLSIPEFEHDITRISNETYRLEADFCELTCAVIRVSAAIEVGGFDNSYGFYHEDVDFGFRLREAGYTAAYLPQSQIEHFSGSTFRQGQDKKRLTYISRSKDVFTKKHLGFGVKYLDHKSTMPSSWSIINRNLYPYILRNGMLDNSRPELVFSHPGEHPFDYLYSVWETSRLPEKWRKFATSYLGVFLPSKWNLEVFRAEGFANTHYVPLGVETDTFNAWGPTERLFDELTYLWFARDQYRKGLDVMLEAWVAFHKIYPKARLVVMGHGICDSGYFDKESGRRWQNYLIYDDREHNISFREVVIPLREEELARIYRSVDCVISTSRSEGFGFSVVEAMACGTLSIFPGYGATADMDYEAALSFSGQIVDADYSDKNFSNVGHWWEPDLENVIAAMISAYQMDAATRKLHARRAYNLVSGKFTWRNTAFQMRKALASGQERKSLDWTQISQSKSTSNDLQRPIRDILADPSLLAPSNYAFSTDDIDQTFSSFDADYYFSVYSDIQDVSGFALWHFVLYGCLEGRQPSREFSTRQYLLANAGVRMFLAVFHGLRESAYRGQVMRSFAQWEERNLFRCVVNDVGQDNEDFIKMCFQVLLRRSPDQGGLHTFLHLAQSGPSGRASVLEELIASNERRSLVFSEHRS